MTRRPSALWLLAVPPVLLVIAYPPLFVRAAVLVLLGFLAIRLVIVTEQRDEAIAEAWEAQFGAAPAATPLSRKGKGVQLRAVPTQRDGCHDDAPMDPVADESWLAETPLLRGDDGRWS